MLYIKYNFWLQRPKIIYNGILCLVYISNTLTSCDLGDKIILRYVPICVISYRALFALNVNSTSDIPKLSDDVNL